MSVTLDTPELIAAAIGLMAALAGWLRAAAAKTVDNPDTVNRLAMEHLAQEVAGVKNHLVTMDATNLATSQNVLTTLTNTTAQVSAVSSEVSALSGGLTRLNTLVADHQRSIEGRVEGLEHRVTVLEGVG